MSLLYTPNFKYPEGDLRKSQEFTGSSPHYHQQNYNQQHNNSGLTPFRSAPRSYLESSANGSNNNGSCSGNSEDFRYFRPSSPEIDTFLAKYTVMPNGSGDYGSRDVQEFGEKAMKQEEAEYANGSSQTIYQNLSVHSFTNDNPVSVGNGIDNSFSLVTSMGLENSMQEKMATGNGSNLIRQNSSPAGLFSNLGVDIGFGMRSDVGGFRAGSSTNGETSTSTSRLSTHTNLSFRSSSRFMCQIPEHGNQSIRTSSPEKSLGGNNGSSTQHMSNFTRDTWDNSSFSGFKRVQDDDSNIFFGLNALETQNGNSGNQPTRLIHHLSLPKTSAEMSAAEKFLNFQGSVPCKIRAKRGCATHPRSIAERVRRTRISERIRKLQDLFPNMDKQTNTADMLDSAVEYIKDLQKQIKTLTDNKAKCTCPSNQKQY